MPKADIAIVTVLPEEYSAVNERLKKEGCSLQLDLGSANQSNAYGWVTGELTDQNERKFQIVVAAAISPGPTHMASAVSATIARYKPHYVLLVGIAGGFPLDGQSRGDVAISSVIYNYEYGKLLSDEFQARHDDTYQVDRALLGSALTLHARDPEWSTLDEELRPDKSKQRPKLRSGAVASGNKVVDAVDNAFFASVYDSWPKVLAVEMEGAGAVATVNSVVSGGRRQVGFLMIRGISDMPKVGGGDDIRQLNPTGNTEGNKAERDMWKKYAAAIAANFTIHWIKRGWPAPPAPRRAARVSGTKPLVDGDDDQPPPPAAAKLDPKAVSFEPFTVVTDSSIQLGLARALFPAGGDPSRGGPILAVNAERLDRPDSTPESVFDTELEVIRLAIERHETEVAEVKLKELEVRAVDKLQPHQWYHLKALRSRILSSQWKWKQAGRVLLDAKRHTPDTERARINEALGYELLGEKEKAHAIATTLRAEFTQTIRLLTIWVRTAPATVTFDSIVEITASFVNEDEELNLAVAYRAFQEGRFDEAAPFALRATELDPKSPHAWFVLGEAKHATGYSKSPHFNLLLNEAEQHYTRAVELAKSQKLSGLEAAIRFNRGKVRHLLGDSRAEGDYLRAVELADPDQRMRTEYASLLIQLDRHADALRELEAESGEPTGDRLYFEAAARYGRNVGDDRQHAHTLLQSLISAEMSDRWDDAHILLVHLAVENKTQRAARDTIDQSGLREINAIVFHTLHGWLWISENDKPAAQAALHEALDALTDATHCDHVFLLAQVLVSADDDALALPLLEKCYRPGVLNSECKKLLDAARRLERHDVSRRVCRELREAGTTDPGIIETEIGILQMYEPNEALQVASEHLAKHPGHRHIALWQSALALRLDRPELIIADLARLPLVDDVTPEGSGLVVEILSETGQHSAALRYAYDALRAHFDSEFSHGHYIFCCLKLSPHCPELRVGGRADPATAVCYRQERDEIDHWVIIEDGLNPNLARGEFAPDHPVSKALAGHSVGDTVVLSDSGIQAQVVTIRQAFHKFVYRFLDCRDRYQLRFPGGSAVQMIHVGTGDEVDLSPIVKSLDDRRKYIENLDELYRSQPMPFWNYAERAGSDEIDVWGHLVANPNLGIRCSSGDNLELRAAIDIAKECDIFVLDLTALLTLARLDLLRLFKSGPRKFVVSQTVYDRVQQLAKKADEERGLKNTVALTNDGQLGRIETTAEEQGRHADFLLGIRDAVRDNCEIRPCPQTAALDPVQRQRMANVIGRQCLDSILLSTTPGAVLWTDDLILSIIGRTDFQARRVWTQAVLFVMRQDGAITQQEFDQALAKLVGWHYHGMVVNEDTLVAAAEIAEWKMDKWPARQVVQTLGNTSADSRVRLNIAARAILAVWRQELSVLTRQGFLFAVLSGLRSERLVRQLHRQIPQHFSVDVISANEVQDDIAGWLRHPSGLLLP